MLYDSLIVMATISCIDVGASRQFVMDRSFAIVAEGSFLLRCLSSILQKARHPFSGEGDLNSGCSSYYKRVPASWQLHPRITGVFFVPFNLVLMIIISLLSGSFLMKVSSLSALTKIAELTAGSDEKKKHSAAPPGIEPRVLRIPVESSHAVPVVAS